jgi:hypothetical protein
MYFTSGTKLTFYENHLQQKVSFVPEVKYIAKCAWKYVDRP